MNAVVPVAPVSAGRDALDRLDAAARRIDADHLGCRLQWRGWGDGPPLVLIHGGHGSWMHWVRNIEALARQHTVWVPDLPGFGDSDDLTNGDASVPHGTRFASLLEVLGNTLDAVVGTQAPIDLAGFSFGGLVAAALAAERGGDGRLALIGSAGHGGRRRRDIKMVNWRSGDRAMMLECLRHNLAIFMLHDPAAIDDLAMVVHEASCVKTRYRSKATSREPGRLQQALARLHGPVLLLWGEHDVSAVPEEIGPQLTSGVPKSEWSVVPVGGHWLQYECADEVNRRLASWFAPVQGKKR